MIDRRTILTALLGAALGAVAGLGTPASARAQKLPVDCSGNKLSCFDYRHCTLWQDHTCYEWTTDFWYYYK
jgi:hypothetical protein